MKRYKTRPGVVLTEIAGQHMLVAARELRPLCPYTVQINETAAFCWRILEGGADLDALTAAMMKEYDIADPAEVRSDLEELLEQLQKCNYLTEEL